MERRKHRLYKSPFGYGFIEPSDTTSLWFVWNGNLTRCIETITGRMGEYLDWLRDEGVLVPTLVWW